MYHTPEILYICKVFKRKTPYKYPKAMKSGKQMSQTSEITKYSKLPLISDLPPAPPPSDTYTHIYL